MNKQIEQNNKGDSFKRPIPFLPSFKKKTVMVLYHVVIWVLIVLIAITATGVTTHDKVKIIYSLTLIISALLVPLVVNSHPQLPDNEVRRATISLVISFGIFLIVVVTSLFLQAKM